MKKTFRIPSHLEELHKASQDVLDFLAPLGLSAERLFDIRLCLEEALINAIKYGNRLDKKKFVNLTIEAKENELRILVEDQGEGFDIDSLEDCTKESNLLKVGGRGVFLIRQLMDKVEYNRKGNSVLMVKSLARKAS